MLFYAVVDLLFVAALIACVWSLFCKVLFGGLSSFSFTITLLRERERKRERERERESWLLYFNYIIAVMWLLFCLSSL